MLYIVVFLLASSVTCQVVERIEFSEFSLATGQSNQVVCAASTADRTCNVRSKIRCIAECQHGGSEKCVGINYRQSSNVCEIYDQCPTNFTTNAADYYKATSSFFNLTSSTLPTATDQSVFDWIVIQQRVPTTVSQYNWQQTWSFYKNGFGNSSSNFWLGLENVHLLTSGAQYMLRIELQQTSTGLWFSAEYSTFQIGNEIGTHYQLIVSGYSGDAGDALHWTGDWNGNGNYGYYLHNGMPFTTVDQNNCYSFNCATDRGGGWWYNDCYIACLTCDDAHARWDLLPGDGFIMAARMKIKLNA